MKALLTKRSQRYCTSTARVMYPRGKPAAGVIPRVVVGKATGKGRTAIVPVQITWVRPGPRKSYTGTSYCVFACQGGQWRLDVPLSAKRAAKELKETLRKSPELKELLPKVLKGKGI